MKQVFRNTRMGWAAGLAIALTMVSVAGAQRDDHGRKWKPLPPTAHIVVTVVKGFNGKPMPNAAVVFHAVRDGKDDGNLEVKTDPNGNATIDVIEIGSHLSIQVIASGFATSARELEIDGPTKSLEVKMIRPRAQVSVYEDNDGRAAQVKPGVQVHEVTPTPPAAASKPETPQAGSPQ
ncbi:MAG TPA: carboxypeptidase-like regulatory domain-containing protein [Acidobacteriaceae bacterium]